MIVVGMISTLGVLMFVMAARNIRADLELRTRLSDD
jgi:hypothetical protein